MVDKQTKKRVSKACDCCRKSKTKCDGMRPCKRCLEDGKICTYMNKKKQDQMYPASYVDLLETRVSILVQSLNSLLVKAKATNAEHLLQFCNDPELLNANGDFDMNKVILKLVPNEKLDNLAESNEDYSIDDITHVTHDELRPRSSSFNSTPSPSAGASASASHHYSLSKAANHSDNHIHKSNSMKKSSVPSNVNSLNSSFQAKFTIGSPNESGMGQLSNHSLDITNSRTTSTPSSLESLLYNTKEDFRDVNSLTSPIQDSNSDLFSLDTIPSTTNTLDEYLMKNQQTQANNWIGNVPIKQEESLNSLDNFDLTCNPNMNDATLNNIYSVPRFEGIIEQ